MPLIPPGWTRESLQECSAHRSKSAADSRCPLGPGSSMAEGLPNFQSQPRLLLQQAEGAPVLVLVPGPVRGWGQVPGETVEERLIQILDFQQVEVRLQPLLVMVGPLDPKEFHCRSPDVSVGLASRQKGFQMGSQTFLGSSPSYSSAWPQVCLCSS